MDMVGSIATGCARSRGHLLNWMMWWGKVSKVDMAFGQELRWHEIE